MKEATADLGLDLLDPKQFPDHSAILAFIEGDGMDAVRFSIEEALNPESHIPHATCEEPWVNRLCCS